METFKERNKDKIDVPKFASELITNKIDQDLRKGQSRDQKGYRKQYLNIRINERYPTRKKSQL